MELDIYQVDAFAERIFEGNPAAVCPLPHWLPDALLQKIADENNLSETAFFVQQPGQIPLRWFTPEAEVDLCGHATLATAHVLFRHLGFAAAALTFSTRSGTLTVCRAGPGYSMDFPARKPVQTQAPPLLPEALGVETARVLLADDYVVVLEHESQVRRLSPDFSKLAEIDARGVVVTARGEEADFVSRCFFPRLRVNEDPVTGSAHCELAPYWAQQLGKTDLLAKQLSRRSGFVSCRVAGDRVELTGTAVDYMKGRVYL
jgi:predicted PhzF superfamily epimerase YddE/YHI9